MQGDRRIYMSGRVSPTKGGGWLGIHPSRRNLEGGKHKGLPGKRERSSGCRAFTSMQVGWVPWMVRGRAAISSKCRNGGAPAGSRLGSWLQLWAFHVELGGNGSPAFREGGGVAEPASSRIVGFFPREHLMPRTCVGEWSLYEVILFGLVSSAIKRGEARSQLACPGA